MAPNVDPDGADLAVNGETFACLYVAGDCRLVEQQPFGVTARETEFLDLGPAEIDTNVQCATHEVQRVRERDIREIQAVADANGANAQSPRIYGQFAIGENPTQRRGRKAMLHGPSRAVGGVNGLPVGRIKDGTGTSRLAQPKNPPLHIRRSVGRTGGRHRTIVTHAGRNSYHGDDSSRGRFGRANEGEPLDQPRRVENP
ncbi:hypothetical protein H7H82_21715 [Mycobacterium heidelbergense]|uniref:hypothetical protein n=1 Tax=Mycobacterium heidelbergense TaxID=53376 RepID=UPI001E439E02|nr:hypothetical protein [Mycobacterium heidelbergense]MCV7053173.1 hypothetical protein [Mycobacterium heidelbergense]